MHICILLLMQNILFLVYTSSERNCSTLFRKCSIHFLKNGSIYSLSICWYIPPKNGSIYSFNFVGIYSFKKFSIYYLKRQYRPLYKENAVYVFHVVGYISSTTLVEDPGPGNQCFGLGRGWTWLRWL